MQEVELLPMASEDNHPFWQFSIDVYGKDGVADACLVLQERHGIDVNIMLFCCWAASAGHPALSSDEIAAARAAVVDWNKDIVQGLRAVRNRLKEGLDGFDTEDAEALRQRVLGIEINAEHKEQLRLAASVPVRQNSGRSTGENLAAAAANIAVYFKLATNGDADPASELSVILRKTFPTSEEEAVETALAGVFGETA